MGDLTPEMIKQKWDLADKDGSGTLSFKEIVRLVKKLNMKKKTKEMKKFFREVDADKSGELDYEEFIEFLNRLRVRPEIVELFEKLSSKKGYLTPEEFAKFLKVVQKEEKSIEQVKELIHQLQSQKSHEEKTDHLHVNEFSKYLSSVTLNSIFNPKHETIYQPMDQPFAHYWIASSHNTYLLGDQLKGESSPQAYINAFEKSCRCVELDCWDGPDISEPIIYHGHTLTSKITFKEVCETIRDYGFKQSEYPVILSLEVHCSIEGQKHMARILTEVLGEHLPPQPDVTGELLPPEKYKRKVLLKGKMLPSKKPDLTESQPAATEEEEEDEEEEIEENDPEIKLTEEQKQELEKEKKEKKKKVKVAEELSKLIHFKAVHFHDFETSKKKGKPWEMSSFSENKVNKILSKQAAPFVDYNSRQLSRIYPKGLRVDSSNYDPVPSWNCGSQIVALNYQTGSPPMWLNDGKFLDNGKSGYLLKPEYMIKKDVTFEPEPKSSEKPKSVKTLYVQIVSGWQFPKSEGTAKQEKKTGNVIDPYVKVEVTGISKDKKSSKTKVVKNNGFNPIWKAEFKFAIHNPDLSLVLFTVFDSDRFTNDDFIAQYSLPLHSIREGYRTIPLRDSQGHFYENASLLALFKFV